MDWTTYLARRKRHDRIILAMICAGVVWSLAVFSACAVVIARVS